MDQQKWERDILNRQRNIVFPDTMLNEGRFYRNIASGKAVFSAGQKASLLIIFTYFAVITAVFLAGVISTYRTEQNSRFLADDIWFFTIALGQLLFWTFLSVKAFFPSAAPERKRVRTGYRLSSRP